MSAVAGSKRPRTTARAEVVRLADRMAEPPRKAAPESLRWVPSGRSLLLGASLAAAAGALYLAALKTSIFALTEVEVRGVPPQVAAQVRRALEPLRGKSLVSFDREEADRRLAGIPAVAAASYDRDFPHTLRVFVRAERPVAILRRGPEAWLVSARARVLRQLASRPYPPLPRIWVAPTAEVETGTTLTGWPGSAARAAALVLRARLGVDLRAVRSSDSELTLVTASGLELRLGGTAALPLKLAIAKRVLPLAAGAAYIDVSLPERPVAGYPNSQVEG